MLQACLTPGLAGVRPTLCSSGSPRAAYATGSILLRTPTPKLMRRALASTSSPALTPLLCYKLQSVCLWQAMLQASLKGGTA